MKWLNNSRYYKKVETVLYHLYNGRYVEPSVISMNQLYGT